MIGKRKSPSPTWMVKAEEYGFGRTVEADTPDEALEKVLASLIEGSSRLYLRRDKKATVQRINPEKIEFTFDHKLEIKRV